MSNCHPASTLLTSSYGTRDRARSRFGGFFFKAACPLALGFEGALPRTRPFWLRDTFIVGGPAPRYTAPSRPVLHSGPSAYGPARPALSRLGQRGVTVFSRGVTLLFHVLARLYLCPAQFAPVPPTDIEGLQELRQNVAKYAGQR